MDGFVYSFIHSVLYSWPLFVIPPAALSLSPRLADTVTHTREAQDRRQWQYLVGERLAGGGVKGGVPSVECAL